MNRRSALPALLLLAAAATPAAARPLFDPNLPVAFVCTVQGKRAIDPATACAAFRVELERGLGRRVVAAPSWPVRGNVVQISLNFASARAIDVAAVYRSGAKTSRISPLTQDVMDKDASLRDLRLLAQQVVRTLIGKVD